jgi:hypothetical protein
MIRKTVLALVAPIALGAAALAPHLSLRLGRLGSWQRVGPSLGLWRSARRLLRRVWRLHPGSLGAHPLRAGSAAGECVLLSPPRDFDMTTTRAPDTQSRAPYSFDFETCSRKIQPCIIHHPVVRLVQTVPICPNGSRNYRTDVARHLGTACRI